MVLVVGATGVLGGMITRQLLAQGEEVRILVRRNSPSEELAKQGMATPAQSLIDAGAQPVYGDLKDRASLDAACRGIDTVLTTANSAMRGGADNVETVDLEGNRNLIEAAEAAGVRAFVFTSANGAAANHPMPFFQAKGASEERLRASVMDYTILSPTIFAESWIGRVVGEPLQAGQPVTLVGEARRRHAFVSIADVAAFASAAVDNPAARNRRLVIGGPESVSWRDIVASCEQVLGLEIPVQFAAPCEPIAGMPEEVVQLVAALETFDSVVDMTGSARTFGVELKTLEVIVGRMFAGPNNATWEVRT